MGNIYLFKYHIHDSINFFFKYFCEAKIFIVLVFLVLLTFPAYSQNRKQAEKRPDIFIAPAAEVIGYGRNGSAFGGGVVIGAEDNGKAMGLRFLYAADSESVSTMELNILLRFYFFNTSNAHTGLFVQLNTGVALCSRDNDDNGLTETEIGLFSMGVSVGWRFPFGKYFFVEPAIRGGYPYIYGAGVSAGCRM